MSSCNNIHIAKQNNTISSKFILFSLQVNLFQNRSSFLHKENKTRIKSFNKRKLIAISLYTGYLQIYWVFTAEKKFTIRAGVHVQETLNKNCKVVSNAGFIQWWT